MDFDTSRVGDDEAARNNDGMHPQPIAELYEVACDRSDGDWTVRREGSADVMAREITRAGAIRRAVELAGGQALLINVVDDGVRIACAPADRPVDFDRTDERRGLDETRWQQA